MAKDNRSGSTSVYKHGQESVQRPDVGVEAQFLNKKPPRPTDTTPVSRPNFHGTKAQIGLLRNG